MLFENNRFNQVSEGEHYFLSQYSEIIWLIQTFSGVNDIMTALAPTCDIVNVFHKPEHVNEAGRICQSQVTVTENAGRCRHSFFCSVNHHAAPLYDSAVSIVSV